MITYIEVKTNSQAATEKKVAELMAQAHGLGYAASTRALRVVPVGDAVEYRQTVWTTPMRKAEK